MVGSIFNIKVGEIVSLVNHAYCIMDENYGLIRSFLQVD